jgi:hypothetical protein
MATQQQFEIRPYQGVGPVDFGDSIDVVASKLGPPDEIVRGKRYMYTTNGFFVDIASDGTVEAVEFFRPDRASIDGVSLAGEVSEVVRRLESHGYQPRRDDRDEASIRFDEQGLILGESPEPDEMESVLAYRRGYWDS